MHRLPAGKRRVFWLVALLPEFGVGTIAFEAEHGPDALMKAVEQAKKKGRVGCLYIETPANPTNALVDIAAMYGRRMKP
jgi:methionine-gamma-lyase